MAAGNDYPVAVQLLANLQYQFLKVGKTVMTGKPDFGLVNTEVIRAGEFGDNVKT
jgi:hypothetical protein